MERQLKIIAYLLARCLEAQTGESVESILSGAESATANDGGTEASGDAVERLYKLYPSKCPVRGTSTGKNSKNKVQLKRLLKDHSAAELEYIMQRYVSDCISGQCYIKNFSTFLNQLPDYSDDGQGIFLPVERKNRPQE